MKTHNHGNILYQVLPAVYREKDKNKKDLEKYMQVCGTLLDQIHQTLVQRYADNFPDGDEIHPSDLTSQPWLLPYFAKLLDVHLVSPTDAGKRKEIANAIQWRKAKGTVHVVEQVAEAVGGYEVVVHEGRQRVALTPHVDMKLIPPTAYGYAGDYKNDDNLKSPALAARHPGLPAATVDFQCPAKAIMTDIDNPAVNISHADGKEYFWRQSNYHGIPCHPGSFDDPTRRTPDMRTLTRQHGHFHPDHLLLFRPVHAGFFGPVQDIKFEKDVFAKPPKTAAFTVNITGDQIKVSNASLHTKNFTPLKITSEIKIADLKQPDCISSHPCHWHFEGFIFDKNIELLDGVLELTQCAVRSINETGVVPGTNSPEIKQPVIKATDCLFGGINVGRGKTHLTCCTVLETTITEIIEASDSIFVKEVAAIKGGILQGCIRYSALPPSQASKNNKTPHQFNCVNETPIFYSGRFGKSGAGVLHPATSRAIKNGAEDGTEMGAYHHLHLMQLDQAVLKKLQDFLPIGIQAAVIPDPALNRLSEYLN